MHYPDWQPLQWRASTHVLPRLATSTVESLYTCITQTGNLYSGEPLHMYYPDWQPLQWRASTHVLPRLATSTVESLYTCITQTGNLYSGEPLHMYYPDWQPLQWRASTHALPRHLQYYSILCQMGKRQWPVPRLTCTTSKWAASTHQFHESPCDQPVKNGVVSPTPRLKNCLATSEHLNQLYRQRKVSFKSRD